MSARIKFEDLSGKPLGHVDLKGKKLEPSNDMTTRLVESWPRSSRDPSPEGFMKYYGNVDNSGSFLYSVLVDSDTDETKYPED